MDGWGRFSAEIAAGDGRPRGHHDRRRSDTTSLRHSVVARDFVTASGDYLEINSAVALAAPITVSGWMRSNNTLIDQVVLSIVQRGTGEHYMALVATLGLNNVWWTARGGIAAPSQAITTAPWTANTWHHVCGIEASPTDRRAYLDGGNKGTDATSRTPAGLDRTSIARAGFLPSGFAFSGDLAHVAVWDAALTDAEVASLAAGASPLSMRRDSLIAYWPVGGHSPEPDIVGGLDMTLFGAPAQSEEPPVPHSIVAPG